MHQHVTDVAHGTAQEKQQQQQQQQRQQRQRQSGPAVGDHKVQQSSSNRSTVLVMAVHLEHSLVLCCDQGQQQQQQQGQQAPEFPAASS
jgi:hypothetical protein